MGMDIAALFDDPRLMFFGVEGEFARFVPMTRESYARSIFFDRRLQPAEPRIVQVPLEPLLAHLADSGFTPPGLRFIHHFAHSGSTLLARALDHPGNLVIREPAHLRQLGVSLAKMADGPIAKGQLELLQLSLAMLGKRFAPGTTVIIKGNVPISLLAGPIAEMDPDQPALLLHFPLEDYCAAVLPKHRQWVERVTAEIAIGVDPRIGDITGLSIAEKAAALWYSMIKRYERLLATHPAMRSLDANQLFDRPADAVAAASGLLGAGLSRRQARDVADGPLFSTYSKNPNLPFDNKARLEQRAQAKAQLAEDLKAARRWVEERAGADGVPSMLGRPLLGESAPLL